MMLPFRNHSFIGTIINSEPLPEGINSTYWFRWDLSSRTTLFDRNPYANGQSVWVLDGTFVNLYQDVLDGDICRSGLIKDDATSEWFEQAVGNGTDLKFYWYSDMHLSLDSEFVPFFSNQVSYMTSLPNPAMLLASNVVVEGKEFSFVIHGTPVGVLQSFSGRFSKQLHPAIGCDIN